jgi:hypothetical protein
MKIIMYAFRVYCGIGGLLDTCLRLLVKRLKIQ